MSLLANKFYMEFVIRIVDISGSAHNAKAFSVILIKITLSNAKTPIPVALGRPPGRIRARRLSRGWSECGRNSPIFQR